VRTVLQSHSQPVPTAGKMPTEFKEPAWMKKHRQRMSDDLSVEEQRRLEEEAAALKKREAEERQRCAREARLQKEVDRKKLTEKEDNGPDAGGREHGTTDQTSSESPGRSYGVRQEYAWMKKHYGRGGEETTEQEPEPQPEGSGQGTTDQTSSESPGRSYGIRQEYAWMKKHYGRGGEDTTEQASEQEAPAPKALRSIHDPIPVGLQSRMKSEEPEPEPEPESPVAPVSPRSCVDIRTQTPEWAKKFGRRERCIPPLEETSPSEAEVDEELERHIRQQEEYARDAAEQDAVARKIVEDEAKAAKIAEAEATARKIALQESQARKIALRESQARKMDEAKREAMVYPEPSLAADFNRGITAPGEYDLVEYDRAKQETALQLERLKAQCSRRSTDVDELAQPRKQFHLVESLPTSVLSHAYLGGLPSEAITVVSPACSSTATFITVTTGTAKTTIYNPPNSPRQVTTIVNEQPPKLRFSQTLAQSAQSETQSNVILDLLHGRN